jgi:hypothetical protein
MKLEALQVELRPRSAWEGVELGLAMLRHWSGPLLRLSLVTVVPFWLVVLFAPLPPAAGLWLVACAWWLSPLFERLVVFVLARSMFGAPPGVRELWSDAAAVFVRGSARTLTWKRLLPHRALLHPIDVLEGVRGDERRRREREIGNDGVSVMLLVLLLTFVFQVVLWFSAMGLFLFATPAELLPPTSDWMEDPTLLADSIAFHIALTVSSVAAHVLGIWIHAAAGFGLYLQRRTLLEGWDLEVAFRRLGERVRRQRSVVPSSGAAALLAFLSLALFAPRSTARSVAPTLAASRAGTSLVQGPEAELLDEAQEQDESDSELDTEPQGARTEAKEAIERVLAREEFSTVASEDELQFDFDWDLDLPGGTVSRAPLLGAVVQALAWGAGAVALVALLLALVRYFWQRNGGERQAPREAPTHLFGLDVRPQSLPADVVAAALELWRAGDARAALALLYRASIALLVEKHGLVLEISDTESDCLSRTRSVAPGPQAEFFARLTQAWLLCAYARRAPESALFEALCADWPAHFAGGRAR